MQYAVAALALVGAVAALPGAEWDPVKVTTTTTTTKKAEWDPVPTTTTTTKKAEWDPVKDCTYTTTYTEKVWGDAKKTGEWDPYSIVTKTKYLTTDVCTWKAWPEPTPKPETWAPAPAPKKECEAVYSTYTEKVWGDAKKTGEWDPYSIVTKTKTVYPTTCTWAPVVISTTAKPAETWAPVTVKPTTTWAPAPVAPSSSSAKVAQYTGAADKNTLGMGALAIAAVAALL